jgi:hypothetical protein
MAHSVAEHLLGAFEEDRGDDGAQECVLPGHARGRHDPVEEEEGDDAHQHRNRMREEAVRVRGPGGNVLGKSQHVGRRGDARQQQHRAHHEHRDIAQEPQQQMRAVPLHAPDRVERTVHLQHGPHGEHEDHAQAEIREPRGVLDDVTHVDRDDPSGDLRDEVEEEPDLDRGHHVLEDRRLRKERHDHAEHREDRKQRRVREAARDLRAAVVGPSLQHEAQEPEIVAELVGHAVAS